PHVTLLPFCPLFHRGLLDPFIPDVSSSHPSDTDAQRRPSVRDQSVQPLLLLHGTTAVDDVESRLPAPTPSMDGLAAAAAPAQGLAGQHAQAGGKAWAGGLLPDSEH